jgi:valyl-tRNA synthetase
VTQENTEKKAYNHLEVEPKWTKFWLENKLYDTKVNPSNKSFSIALPPPNVTGELHMGHALGGTIQDILIRYNRMQGKDVLWQIGTDHAGIGTQLVVEKDLKNKEKKSKEDLGRDAFIERTKAWKEEYGNKIIEQMKTMGFSPDYNRIRYTMDEHYAEKVIDAFIQYFNDGKIYRGNRIVNWCPKCLTSLSDLEIDKEHCNKKLYEIKYHFMNSNEYLTVATTRPETMFGDTAVAINPSDNRYKKYIDEVKKKPGSLKLRIPFSGMLIPLILDEHVKTDFGTGALKVTPAHDANDFEIANRHELERRIIMDEKGKMLTCNEVPDKIGEGILHGLDRYKARELIVEALEKEKLLVKVSEYEQEKDLHDRCGTEIEPYLSDQWYLDMQELAKSALNTNSEGRSKFIPERYTNTFKAWLENIQDWCISRQIWWGHRIPVFYYDDTPLKVSIEELEEIPRREKNCFVQNARLIRYSAHKNQLDFVSETRLARPELPELTDASMRITRGERNAVSEQKRGDFWQDDDVLDTWFSSALWPFVTMQDDPKIFEHFYPTSVLATAREIINLWVTRMIFSSEYFEKKEPFEDILIHPVVQTPDGKRMSKSKGNAIDPLDMVRKYGADASRMWYASVGVLGQQDVRFPGRKDKAEGWLSDTFEQYRKFANKLFNASRFVMMKLESQSKDCFEVKEISDWNLNKANIADKWILNKFTKVLEDIELAFSNYDLGKVQDSIYSFLWFDFCDWYIELSKVEANSDRDLQKQILYYILENSLRALHPMMPFITEEIWQELKVIASDAKQSNLQSITFAPYPKADTRRKDSSIASEQMEFVIELIGSVRNTRQSLNIAWSSPLTLVLNTNNDFELKAIKSAEEFIKTITKSEDLQMNTAVNKPANTVLIKETQLSIPLAGLVDFEKLKSSIQNKISKIETDLKGLESRLKSENFIKNAAADKVEETKASHQALIKQKIPI